jgi:hypothetical protein
MVVTRSERGPTTSGPVSAFVVIFLHVRRLARGSK